MKIASFFRVVTFLGMLGLLAACGAAQGISSSATAQAVPDSVQVHPDDGGQATALTVDGNITDASDTTLVVRRIDGSALTVTLDAHSTIWQQVPASRADLAPNADVTVLTEERDGQKNAVLVQIGVSGMPRMAFGNGPAGDSSAGNAPAPGTSPVNIPLGGTTGPQPTLGKVQGVAESTLSIKSDDGTVHSITLTPQTSYQKEDTTDHKALQVGALVIIEGQREGSVFRALKVHLLSAKAA